ncbi:MAG: hypothetical protein Fur005_44640 [Roseiflexaceae bacterium]
MPDFATIYAHYADAYDQLVSREDYQGNILKALRRILSLQGIQVAEFGAGTGRVTRILAPWVRHVAAHDRSAHMLEYAKQRLRERSIDNVSLAIADNAAVPLASGVADLAIAGWSFGHATEWDAQRWRQVIGQGIAEMQRVLRPGGRAIIIETLGTGQDVPNPPSQVLSDYYAWLEHELHFQRTWIRTDYRFNSQEEADRLTGFFFGSPSPTILQSDQRVVVPECSGIWWR